MRADVDIVIISAAAQAPTTRKVPFGQRATSIVLTIVAMAATALTVTSCDDKDNECTAVADNQVGTLNAGSSEWNSVYNACKDS